MSSKFIVVVDILGCNFIVTDLISHLYICTTALGKKNMFVSMRCSLGLLLVVARKIIGATFFLCRYSLYFCLFITLISLN